LLKAIAPFRQDIVVAVECILTWYWLADLCAREGMAFVPWHALYMKAIHGGKAKNDKMDGHKIAVPLRGGMIPQADVYPAQMRSTRDLLRRRMLRMRRRAELLAHIQRTNHQYNLPDIGKELAYRSNREGVAERFVDARVQSNVALDLKRIDFYDDLLGEVELEILGHTKPHDANSLYLLDIVPGIGKILSFGHSV
jgi:hypothetical protein